MTDQEKDPSVMIMYCALGFGEDYVLEPASTCLDGALALLRHEYTRQLPGEVASIRVGVWDWEKS